MATLRHHRAALLAAALAITATLSACAAPSATPTAESETTETTETTPPSQPAPESSEAPTSAKTPDTEPDAGLPNPGFDQATLDELLRQTAWSNDSETAAQLIDWGANVNAPDHTQQSAYLVSTSEGHLEYLRLMLANGADIHSLDSWVGTGLIRAAERGHWDVVGALAASGIPRDHVNRVGYQAIHEAVWMGRDDQTYHATTRVLFAAGANFSTPSGQEGLTPLQMAERRGFTGQAEVIRLLLAEPVPADPNAALFAAAEIGHVAATAVALRAGADLSAVDASGRTAAEIASANSHVLTLQLLTALDPALLTPAAA